MFFFFPVSHLIIGYVGWYFSDYFKRKQNFSLHWNDGIKPSSSPMSKIWMEVINFKNVYKDLKTISNSLTEV